PNNPLSQSPPLATLFTSLRNLRSPSGGVGQNDRPFLPMTAGVIPSGDAQAPNGRGISDTLLRSTTTGNNPTQPRLLDATPFFNARHEYEKSEMVTKVFDRFTVRSNVFAVWVTVGFFEVTNPATQPPTLGAEIGRSEGRHIRHRMFSIIDRSVLTQNP